MVPNLEVLDLSIQIQLMVVLAILHQDNICTPIHQCLLVNYVASMIILLVHVDLETLTQLFLMAVKYVENEITMPNSAYSRILMSQPSPQVWLIDSGATSHMTVNLNNCKVMVGVISKQFQSFLVEKGISHQMSCLWDYDISLPK